MKIFASVAVGLMMFLPAQQLADGFVGMGGMLAPFKQRYGNPFREIDSTLLDFQRCPGRAPVAGLSVNIHANGRIRAITRNQCGSSRLSAREAEADVVRLLPPDAKKVSSYATEDGWQGAQYRSETLANAFPSKAFDDCRKGRLLPGGTVSYALSPQGTTWVVGLGACL